MLHYLFNLYIIFMVDVVGDSLLRIGICMIA